MNASYTNGQLTISLADLFIGLNDGDKDEFIDRMACEDGIIKAVSDQILIGWTELNSHGSTCGTKANPTTVLDKLTREVAKRSGEVAKEQIERLELALKDAEEKFRKSDAKTWALYRLVRDTHGYEAAERCVNEAAGAQS